MGRVHTCPAHIPWVKVGAKLATGVQWTQDSVMLIGVGTDVLEIGRLERELRKGRSGLCGEVFTDGEIERSGRALRPARQLATWFAAKEALYKALCGSSRRGLCWREMEVCLDNSGRPQLALSGSTKALADERGVKRVLVSLSDTTHFAMASVMLES